MRTTKISRSRFAAALAAAVVALGITRAEAADAQPRAGRVPFAAGEQATYQVKLGAVPIGSGTLSVTGIETVQGEPAFHAVMTLRGGNAIFRVNDRYESWIDTDGLFSRRFHQNLHEGRYRRNRTYDFNSATRSFRRENGQTGTMPTNQPLDDLSFLYYARTLPLEVGATYTLQRYFKADGNPVVLHVVRRETITVPAGRYRTIVVRPEIQTDGLFGKGGRAEVYFSDDAYRIPVFIRTEGVPIGGDLTMRLRSFRPGT